MSTVRAKECQVQTRPGWIRIEFRDPTHVRIHGIGSTPESEPDGLQNQNQIVFNLKQLHQDLEIESTVPTKP